jgi:hypothetical protein
MKKNSMFYLLMVNSIVINGSLFCGDQDQQKTETIDPTCIASVVKGISNWKTSDWQTVKDVQNVCVKEIYDNGEKTLANVKDCGIFFLKSFDSVVVKPIKLTYANFYKQECVEIRPCENWFFSCGQECISLPRATATQFMKTVIDNPGNSFILVAAAYCVYRYCLKAPFCFIKNKIFSKSDVDIVAENFSKEFAAAYKKRLIDNQKNNMQQIQNEANKLLSTTN